MLRIVKASEPLLVEQLVLCIYSPPGLGKTSLGFTADDPLNLDFDNGVHRAANRKDSVRIGSWEDVTAISPEELTPYKTIIADTAGRALDFLSADIIAKNPKLGRGGALTLQGFGELKVKFSAWLKMLRLLKKDVVLIAHMDEQRSGDDIVERLDVQGSSKGEIYKSADAMGRIVIRNGKRFLDISPRENSFGKNPCGLELLEFPDPALDGNSLGKLIASIKAGINKVSAEQKAAQDELTEWEVAFNDCQSVDDLNQYIGDVKASRSTAVKMLMMRRAKQMGLTFNKVSNLYEANHVAVG